MTNLLGLCLAHFMSYLKSPNNKINQVKLVFEHWKDHRTREGTGTLLVKMSSSFVYFIYTVVYLEHGKCSVPRLIPICFLGK